MKRLFLIAVAAMMLISCGNNAQKQSTESNGTMITKTTPNPENALRAQQFLKDAGTYYLATVDGDQPHVRPFGTAEIFEGKLYIQTGKVKNVYKQLEANPKAEICAFKDGKWIRIVCELVADERVEAKKDMLANKSSHAYPIKESKNNEDSNETRA